MEIFQIGFLAVYMLCLSPVSDEPGGQLCFVVVDKEGKSTEAVCEKAMVVWEFNNQEVPLKYECESFDIHFLTEIAGTPA